jgi:GAF domain-containing protein
LPSLVPLSMIRYVLRTKERVLMEDAAAVRAGFATDEYFSRHKPKSVLCLPVLRKGVETACLYLENDLVPAAFTPDRLVALELIASQFAISLDSALVLERERAARGRAELVAEATALLSAVFEYPRVLDELARLCVRSLADWATVSVVDAGSLQQVAGAHRDPQKQPLLAGVSLPLRVFETGRPVLSTEVDEAELLGHAVDEAHAELARGLAIRSLVSVPLVARGERLGVLTLGSETPGRYREADLQLARELADRAAVAIDNARLTQAESQALERLARVALAIRDMANTPLQTLTLSLALLGPQKEQREIVFRMERALDRLKELDDALSRYASQIRWKEQDVAFDPLAVIEEAAPRSKDK